MTADTALLARDLQERVALALPAEHVERLAGWWLRHTTVASWWLGTVLPHGSDDPELIEAAERFYARHGTPARFQITPGACADGLEAALAARGYRSASSISIHTADTAQVAARATGDVVVTAEPTDAWFDVWHDVNGGRGRHTELDMFTRTTLPAAYASVVADGRVIAVGRAVADRGWAGVFCMATRPEARGRGAARTVLGGLARWAAGHAVPSMYLQVENSNAVALRLYEWMSFAKLCDYHYRVAPPE